MKYRLVVIGASLRGLHSLRGVLSTLPATFRPAVAIVQHRSADADDTLQFLLQKECAHLVREVEDKEAIIPGKIYLAPGGYHLMVEGHHFALSMEASVNYAQPSIDLLFKTAAEHFGSRVIDVGQFHHSVSCSRSSLTRYGPISSSLSSVGCNVASMAASGIS